MRKLPHATKNKSAGRGGVPERAASSFRRLAPALKATKKHMGDLNSSHLIPQRQRLTGLKGAIESFEMFDSSGNCCGAALFGPVHNKPPLSPSRNDWSGYVEGEPVFEVMFSDFNNCDPHYFRGSLGNCKMRMQLFFERKEKEGFTPTLADPPHAPIN